VFLVVLRTMAREINKHFELNIRDVPLLRARPYLASTNGQLLLAIALAADYKLYSLVGLPICFSGFGCSRRGGGGGGGLGGGAGACLILLASRAAFSFSTLFLYSRFFH